MQHERLRIVLAYNNSRLFLHLQRCLPGLIYVLLRQPLKGREVVSDEAAISVVLLAEGDGAVAAEVLVEATGAREPHRQYLYFCTSKASKLSAW
jgi:hypothetical protein